MINISFKNGKYRNNNWRIMKIMVNYKWAKREGGNFMKDEIIITKKDIEEMELLSTEELEKLNFHELCAYLGMLDMAEKVLEGSDE